MLAFVRENWFLAIPDSAARTKGCVTIEFAIQKNGHVADMKLVVPSGEVLLDRAAWAGITASDPFPPLPEVFHGPSLALRFRFSYNPKMAGPAGPQTTPAVAGPAPPGQEAQQATPETVYVPLKDGVTAPKAIYQPDPEYTDRARRKKINGSVVLSMIVTPDGTVRDPEVTKSLDKDLDKQAIACVKKWTFQPATKDGKPVAVRLSVEVSFHLY
jgi:TonB family protein